MRYAVLCLCYVMLSMTRDFILHFDGDDCHDDSGKRFCLNACIGSLLLDRTSVATPTMLPSR